MSEPVQMRMLNARINPATTEMVDVDGGLLVKNMLLIDEGEWTDSAIGTPLFYPAKTLEKFGTNWSSNTIYDRHTSGSPRSITNMVGRAKNLRFMNTGVWGDVFVHGRTQNSKDTIELLKSGEITDISIEHFWTEKFNKDTKKMEADWMDIAGAAFVERGACRTCGVKNGRIPLKANSESCESDKTLDTPIAVETDSENVRESAEMDAEIEKLLSQFKADFDTRLKAIEGSLSEVKAMSGKEMAEKYDGLSKELGEAKVKIKMLEETGTQHGVVQSPAPVELRTKTAAVYSVR